MENIGLPPHDELLATGRRFNTLDAQQERARALDLGRAHAKQLEPFGISQKHLARLEALLPALHEAQRLARECDQAQEAASLQLNAVLEECLDLMARTSSLARSALGKARSSALSSLPSRSKARQKLSTLIDALLEYSGFVVQYAAAFAAAGAEPGLAARLDESSRRLGLANEVQEKAKASALEANDILCTLRGETYVIAGLIYHAGKSLYRRSAEQRSLFSYEYMRANKSAATSSEKDEKTEETEKGEKGEKGADSSSLLEERARTIT